MPNTPVGKTVIIMTGPVFLFSMNSGERMSAIERGRGTM